MKKHRNAKKDGFFMPYSFKYGHIGRIVDLILSRSKGDLPLRVLDVGVDDRSYYPTLQTLGTLTTLDPVLESGADIAADICDCDIPDNSYDVVFLFYVLEHLSDPSLALASCKRIVRPGGFVAGIVPQYWHTHGYPSDYWRFTKSGITHLVQSCGLRIFSAWPTGGPFLVAFHALEIAMRLKRKGGIFCTLLYNTMGRVLNALDHTLTSHGEKEGQDDCVAWCFISVK